MLTAPLSAETPFAAAELLSFLVLLSDAQSKEGASFAVDCVAVVVCSVFPSSLFSPHAVSIMADAASRAMRSAIFLFIMTSV